MLVSQDDLTAAAVGGDEQALIRLLNELDGGLRCWLKSKIGHQYRSSLEACDVLQVTYLEVFLRIQQFEPRGTGSFQAWIHRIALNNLHDVFRELNRDKRPSPNRRVRAFQSEESHAVLLASLMGDGTTPTAGARKKEARDLIGDAIEKLPPDYRTVVRLYDLEGLSAQEIASRMKRSTAAVHMLKARAHDRLAELLGGSTNFFSNGA